MTDTKLVHFIHRGYERGGISCHHLSARHEGPCASGRPRDGTAWFTNAF